jgi:hypothetical protein
MTRHFASNTFWSAYEKHPAHVQELADKNFALLKANPQHPSLQLKHVNKYWSVRVGLRHRALGVPVEGGILWFWIGSHAEYDALIRS